MPVEMLIHATDKTSGAKKGFIQAIKDDTLLAVSPWGNKEGLPAFVVLRVSNATISEVNTYLDPWKNTFSYELLTQNASGRRYKISVNQNAIAEYGFNKSIRTEINDFITSTFGGTLVDYQPSQGYATYDVPNTDWVALPMILKDNFEEYFSTRKFIFSPTDVDLAVTAGGYVTQTKAQAVARITDRGA